MASAHQRASGIDAGSATSRNASDSNGFPQSVPAQNPCLVVHYAGVVGRLRAEAENLPLEQSVALHAVADRIELSLLPGLSPDRLSTDLTRL